MSLCGLIGVCVTVDQSAVLCDTQTYLSQALLVLPVHKYLCQISCNCKCYCPPMLMPSGVMDEKERSPISSMTPDSINIGGITKSCRYSHVLLMMGEDIARNMQS